MYCPSELSVMMGKNSTSLGYLSFERFLFKVARIQHSRKLLNCPAQKYICSRWRRFERRYVTCLGFQFLTQQKLTKSHSVCERPSLRVHCIAVLRRMFLAVQSWNKGCSEPLTTTIIFLLLLCTTLVAIFGQLVSA